MKSLSKIIWGVILVVIGIIFALNSLGIASINIFFKGWWTLFIIVPCFIGLFKEGSKTGDIIGLIIGIILLLAARGIITFGLVLKLIIPIILISIGISLIFGDTFKKRINEKIKEVNDDDFDNIIATFSNQKVVEENKFKNTKLDAIFGGIDLDLRNAKLSSDTVIKATSIFGGIDIFVPKDVNVLLKSNSIFGGVDNKVINNKENTKTIYIETLCLFGGVDIK